MAAPHLPDFPQYRRALRDCFRFEKEKGGPIFFNQIAMRYNVRRQSLMKYFTQLKQEGLTPKDFSEKMIHNGRPQFLSKSSGTMLQLGLSVTVF